MAGVVQTTSDAAFSAAARTAQPSPASPQQPPAGAPRGSARRGGWRALVDAGICLYVAVILFRTFELEGYIISTGSMAPSLLGFHKRVVCPACGYPFAFGIKFDALGPAAAGGAGGLAVIGPHGGGRAQCPNCGETPIDVSNVPVNHGDQLLVQKSVYEYRAPRRWEVVVLKSGESPTPYVKRIVGLAHESVQIVDGDVYANGTICRKNLDQQRALRILVCDSDYACALGPGTEGCLTAEPAASPWRPAGRGFTVSPAAGNPPSTSGDVAWLTFHRRMRGAPARDGLVTDDYGYNRADAGISRLPVGDLMLECDVLFGDSSGELRFRLADSRRTFVLVLDASSGTARLAVEGSDKTLRSAAWRAPGPNAPVRVELSNFDRQMLAAVDGQLLFPAYEIESSAGGAIRAPVQIGARGASVDLTRLRIFRDVYYTRGLARNGVDHPIELGADEYFALGDNSPVSNDGRNWTHGAVNVSQIIGKPLVVHLPSRPGRATFGGRTRYFRIPDFSRVRYIR